MKPKLKRAMELKRAVAEIKRTIQLAKQGKIELEGNRPMTALQMQKEVYEAEIIRANKGIKPMYKAQWYSNL
jgi:hypothetical protein